MENKTRQKNKIIKVLKRYKQEQEEIAEDDEHCIAHIYEHILDQILAKIPQEDLLELSYTCKFWNKEIMSNKKLIAQDFLKSKSSLLIQFHDRYKVTCKSKMLELDHDGLGFKLDYLANETRMGHFRSTCNGLILLNSILRLNRSTAMYRFLAVNLVTKCQITIPNCPSGCKHRFCSLALVFTPHQKQYKVVHIYSNRFGFEIFTLGSPGKEWRVIPGPFRDDPYDRSWNSPVSNGQFLHWDVHSGFYILSMDVCNETTWKTYLPHHYLSFRRERVSLIEMGGHLCFMYCYTTAQFDVWVLKDVRGQDWRRSHSIFAESINYLLPCGASPIGEWRNALPNFEKLAPLCSLRNGEVIVFKNVRSLCLYLYDIKIKELRKLSELFSRKNYDVLPYKSSLVSWQNPEELLSRETI